MATLSENWKNREFNDNQRLPVDELQNPARAIEKLTHDMGEKLGAFASQLSERSTEYVATTRRYVKDHPLQSVALAAVAGLTLGALMKGRNNSRRHYNNRYEERFDR